MRPAGRFFFGGGMVSASLGETNGVTSVILLTRKTVISLAAMSSLQGTIPCFITMTLTPLNRILTIITKLTLPRLRKLYAIISSTLLGSFLGCNTTGVTPNFTECWSNVVGIREKCLLRSNFFLAVRSHLPIYQVVWENRQVWMAPSWQCELICSRRLSCVVNGPSREYVPGHRCSGKFLPAVTFFPPPVTLPSVLSAVCIAHNWYLADSLLIV